MTRLKRALSAAVAIAFSMLPTTGSAGATLSPTLDQILVPPPSGFYPYEPPGWPQGFFGLDWYASAYGQQSVEPSKELQQDGFIGGFGLEWIDASIKHAVIENVAAFTGHNGAQRWLSFVQASDRRDSSFDHANAIAGIDEYAGQHYVFPSHNVLDEFMFVKGNDLFIVGFESSDDDVLSQATDQSKVQYALAPPSTIPPSRWPENTAPKTGLQKTLYSIGGASQKTAFSVRRLAPVGLVGLGILAVLGIGSIAALSARRRRSVVRPK